MKHPKTFFFALSLLLSQLMIFFPMISWTQNQFNLDTPFIEGLVIVMTMLAALLTLSAIITWLIPVFLRKYLLPILVILTVLVFLQQNILVGEYGMIDGNSLSFEDARLLTWLDSILWCMGIVCAIFLRRYITQKAVTILTFSGLASVAVIVTALITYDFKSNQSSYSISEKDKFSFSTEKNVLVFLLDAFQSDLFTQFIEDEPTLKEHFNGFTYYPNTTAVFSKTYPTIPLLFTGKVYKKEQPIKEFLTTSYQDSLLTDLVDADWHVEAYPYKKHLLPVDKNIMTNVTKDTGWAEIVADYLQTLDLSLLRSVPHTMKPKIYNNGKFVVKGPVNSYVEQMHWFKDEASQIHKLPRIDEHVGINFLSQLKVYANTKLQQPVFKFYHLMMPHSPFLLDRGLNPRFHENDSTAYHDYSYASIKLMIEYLVELKKLGIYDQSSIMILADHGGGEYHKLAYNQDHKSLKPITENGRAKASGKPLLLFKEKNNNEPFSVSQSPASLLDVMPTLANQVGMDRESEGIPIKQLTESQTRERTYYYYKFTGFDSRYLQDFEIFKISGNVNDESSWQPDGILTTADTSFIEDNNPYQLNQNVGFGKDIKHDSHHSNRFLVNDNHIYHSSSIEPTNRIIELEVPLSEPLETNKTYQLYLTLIAGKNGHPVSISINDITYPELKLDSRLTEHLIPFVVSSDHKSTLRIKIQNAHNNLSVPFGLSKLRVNNIQLYEPIRTDNKFEFKFNADLNRFHMHGFAPTEKWGRWTSKIQTSLLFLKPNDFCKTTSVKLNLQKFYTGVDPDKFKVTINQVPLVLNTEKSDKGTLYYSFECQLASNQTNEMMQLSFETNTTVTPSAVSQSRDRRFLGVGIKSIEFSFSQ